MFWKIIFSNKLNLFQVSDFIIICQMYAMERPKDQEEYHDRWAKQYSDSVQANLCPFYEWFGFKLSNETKEFCKTLPGSYL